MTDIGSSCCVLTVKKLLRLKSNCLVIIAVIGLIIGLREAGVLEQAELQTLDKFFQIRGSQPTSERIIIVGLNESDIRTYKWPLSDLILAKVLNKIKAQSPRGIGLGFYRDLPVEPGSKELAEVFKTTPNLIGVEQVVGDENQIINPPPLLEEKQQTGSNGTLVDKDRVTRRYLLYAKPKKNPNLPSFALKMALVYLSPEKIFPQASPDNWLQIGDAVLPDLDKNAGGYIRNDSDGYQILIDYLGGSKSFKTVSFDQVLNNEIDPNLFHDRLVFVAGTAASLGNNFYTPFGESKGIEIDAHLTSQILSAVLEQRPLIKSLNTPLEYLWIISWILAPVIIVKLLPFKNVRVLGGITVSLALILSVALPWSSYQAFESKNLWLTVVPSGLGLWIVTPVFLGVLYDREIRSNNAKLKREIEKTTKELQSAQARIAADQRLRELGKSVAGLAQQMKNPVNFILNYVNPSITWAEDLKELIEIQSERVEPDHFEVMESQISHIDTNLNQIKNHTERLKRITQMMMDKVQPNNKCEPWPTDINSLIDLQVKIITGSHIKLNIDFGLRVETDYDHSIEPIKIVAQDLTEAVSNLIDNSCDALWEKSQHLKKLGKLESEKDLGAEIDPEELIGLTHSEKIELIEKELENMYKETKKGWHPKIIVKTQKYDNYVEITVEDNGNGLSEELIEDELLFVPFYTTKQAGEGTGLGLVTARDLIVKNHGELFYDPESKYTKFVIKLPLEI